MQLEKEQLRKDFSERIELIEKFHSYIENFIDDFFPELIVHEMKCVRVTDHDNLEYSVLLKPISEFEKFIDSVFEKIENNTDLYELTIYNQSSKSTVRYYYNNEYLLSAPEEMKEELQLKFNELMNIRPKLSINEVKQELKIYKEDATEDYSEVVVDLTENSLNEVRVHENKLSLENISSDNSLLGILLEVVEDSKFNSKEEVIEIVKQELKQLEEHCYFMANISESGSIKKVLINTIQAIEKQAGLKKIDSEETIVNMALVFLYNNFDVALDLDSSEIIEDRNKILKDLEVVAEAIENDN